MSARPAAFAVAVLLLAAAPAVPAASGGADDGFAAFHDEFRAAVGRGDAAAVATLTRLPFLFEGRLHDAAGFRQAVWPALFTPARRRCWATVRALAEPGQPGERSLHCAPYALHFDADGGRWQLREFSADAGQ